MEKGYSMLLKYSLGLLIVLLLFISNSCNRDYDGQYQQLKRELNEIYDIRLPKNVKCIFIINDNYCPVCVKHFSEYVLSKVEEEGENVLCLVNSKGINVDLAKFKKFDNKNIYLNTKTIPYKDDPLIPPRLGVIFLYENKIDTIIRIDSEFIVSQLEFIDSKFD